MKLCDYGCGQEAKYPFKNGKWCCESNVSKCPVIKKLNSEKQVGKTLTESHRKNIGNGVRGKMVGKDHPFYGKTHTEKVKKEQSIRFQNNKYGAYTYKTFLKKFPFFIEFENIREKEDQIEVRCKYEKCRRWFHPTTYQMVTRANAIQWRGTKKDIGHSYMYCSNKCKANCSFYYRKKDPIYLQKYERYKQDTAKYTYKSVSKYFKYIKNSEKKVVGDQLSLDHKYSMHKGFKNNISPKIIGHCKNLKYIIDIQNKSKGSKCSITLEQLLKEIEQFDKKEN